MSILQDSQKRTERAALLYNAPSWLIEELRKPRRIENIKVQAMTKRGEETFTGAVVHDVNPYTIGIPHPYKGGIRYKAYSSEEDMIETLLVLARDMTYKHGLYRLPFGGAKGCMNLDVSRFSQAELKYITQGLVLEMVGANILDPDIFVPGPDYGTNAETMKWMYFFYGKLNRNLHRPNPAAVVTGKPVEFDGFPGRDDATARGGLIVYDALVKSGKALPKMAIQGFGNVGANLFKLLSSPDFQVSGAVVAVADVSSGIYNPKGLTYDDIAKYYLENRSFAGYKEGDNIKPEEIITAGEYDTFFTAAQEGLLNKENASKLKTKRIEELGNAAITEDADQIFEDKGIEVFPDIFANAGGVIVSSFEWRKNRGDIAHDVDLYELETWGHNELAEILKMCAKEVSNVKRKFKTSLRIAAHIVALQRLEFLMQRKKD
ncbi:hypothetical protein A2926_00015 [Candidatus Giovannonibacteria bacterium RIFCSPLOWO2_01_FULL_44_40]|uniref:Glutamate dehydrogenase n=1 Tax=Candidatus Giovannonibacteria bacterium RIFCSPHIGHO2_01_FULL_45_23 TaxID=1798325 RepID=A0A1F5VGZ1_9BACT|nr:MAG: hypothetical protein A2834_00970 [Candidatus Giovannonibacteria bacterium RIFCSPHIGHO2_01_FULL_45_23]OGF80367.1 MAG: hypothetical protein A2926_00015 [Candidatus Giovannonibacteria bacterium RIFCSPLOWO2_01_FULL_44_40]